MDILLYSLFLFLILSCSFLFIYLLSGWKKIKSKRSIDSEEKIFMSVVIPYRNELSNLADLLESLREQDYPADNFELIMVNDHSEDGSFNYLESMKDSMPFSMQNLSLPPEKTSKKAGLKMGIEAANSEFIVTTDADTSRSFKWLSRIASFYRQYKPDLIIGPVKMTAGKNFIEQFQALDFLSLQLVTAAFANHHNPILCNAANLGFSKSAYLGILDQTRQDIASGDDLFLMLGLKKNKKKIRFMSDPQGIVSTKTLNSWREFIDQRLRWAGKSRNVKDFGMIGTALLNLFLILGMLALPIAEISAGHFPFLSITYLILKASGDYYLLHSASSFYGFNLRATSFLSSFFLYPFYISFIFIASLILRPVWKGRKI